MWGSIEANTNPCITCPNKPACTEAVQALEPVHCELELDARPDQPPARARSITRAAPGSYTAHLAPGQVFTAEDLADRANVPKHAAANWCCRNAKRGLLKIAGQIKTGTFAYANLYQYQPTEITT